MKARRRAVSACGIDEDITRRLAVTRATQQMQDRGGGRYVLYVRTRDIIIFLFRRRARNKLAGNKYHRQTGGKGRKN